MKRATLDLLVHPDRHHDFELDLLREHEGDIVEGYLVCSETRAVWPVVGGLALLPPNLRTYIRRHANVIARMPIADPRLTRFVLAVQGSGFDRVNFDDVVAQYCDLAIDPPDGYRVDIDDSLTALGDVLARTLPDRPRMGVDLGCSVGRSTFTLRMHTEHAVGMDYGLAMLRRARNIARSVEDFFLPGLPHPGGEGRGPEVKLDLDLLVREDVDFVAARAESLPFRTGSIDVCVVHAGDRRGTWKDCEAVLQHARRVLRRPGILITEASLPCPGSADHTEGPWCARVLNA